MKIVLPPPPITPTKSLTEITVTNPTKTEYIKNEIFDTSGIIVTAHYNDGTTADVTSSATLSHSSGDVLENVGENTITVTYTEAEVTKTTTFIITVVEQQSSVEIVTWADGTDEQLAAMLDAHYAGQIDINDYWHVGDERVVHLSAMEAGSVFETHVAQDVTMVLMNVGGKELVEPINEKNECAFIVGQKNVLAIHNYVSEDGCMNKTDTSNVGWDGCNRRTWCNEIYRNALPVTFKSLFKQHNNVTADGAGSSNKTSTDYFALPSEKEVFGSTICADSTAEMDNKQFAYYEVSSNRIKKPGAGKAVNWYTRSLYSYGTRFCLVSPDGTTTSDVLASRIYSIAPFGVI